MVTGFADARLENAPKPPAFLDPLSNPEDCFYYSVPTFYEANDPLTSWLLKRILANDVESLKRKLEFSPSGIVNHYFQILDDPTTYISSKDPGAPMFHSKCLLYLTPLGLSLYFKALGVAELFLSFRTTDNRSLVDPMEPQFASHLQDTKTGDFHAFIPFVVLMRRQVFDASSVLQKYGWRPQQPFAMPFRRRYERRVLYCRDWLDAGLALLSSRPVYNFAGLVMGMTAYTYYAFSRLPIGAVKPTSKSARKKAAAAAAAAAKQEKKKAPSEDSNLYEKHGYMPVADRPLSVPLVGAKSVLQLCEMYDHLKQSHAQAKAIKNLLREATAAGLNTEVLRMQAEECIAQDEGRPRSSNNESNFNHLEEPPERGRTGRRKLMWCLNSNNHAKKTKVSVPMEEREHCSEPLRILLYCISKDRSGSCVPQCLDAVGTYVKRNYFNCPQELPPEHGRSRDTRNVVTCLLNMINRQQSAIAIIVERIRMGDQRWRSLETVKQQHTGTIAKVSALMTSVLISSKQIVNLDRKSVV